MMTHVLGRDSKFSLVKLASAALLSALLAGCATPEPPPPPPPAKAPEPGVVDPNAVMLRPHARWASAAWSDLPGWEADATAELWPAFVRSCEKPAFDWVRLCMEARSTPPAPNDLAVRAWLRQRLQPWRVESADGQAEGLMTGYFEPQVDAMRRSHKNFKVPLYAPPADLGQRVPYWTRQQIDSLPAARSSMEGYEIAYVVDPLDALVLQIQGSGRINMIDPRGGSKLVRMAYAGHNDHPYKSVGRWLIDQGELRADQASWPAIKAWAKRNPKRLNEMLWSNPRMVFFREEVLTDPNLGPRGAQGVALTPGRSIAVDPLSIPYGAPVWVDTTEPLSNKPLQRAVVAQDTGTAIVGAARADYFCGWGTQAEQQAGRMKQPLRMWVLWPKN